MPNPSCDQHTTLRTTPCWTHLRSPSQKACVYARTLCRYVAAADRDPSHGREPERPSPFLLYAHSAGPLLHTPLYIAKGMTILLPYIYHIVIAWAPYLCLWPRGLAQAIQQTAVLYFEVYRKIKIPALKKFTWFLFTSIVYYWSTAIHGQVASQQLYSSEAGEEVRGI